MAARKIVDESETHISTRELIVSGDKRFRIRVPTSAKLTFGPFSPPSSAEKGYARTDTEKRGTLRVYEGVNIIGVFSGVTGYRDTSLEYMEEVVREEGATIWKSDRNGYSREEKASRATDWLDPLKPKEIESGNTL